jgi:hypothetical protein
MPRDKERRWPADFLSRWEVDKKGEKKMSGKFGKRTAMGGLKCKSWSLLSKRVDKMIYSDD